MVDASRLRKTQGTGLGLAITKRIIDAMEGDIEVESKVGKEASSRLRFLGGEQLDLTSDISSQANSKTGKINANEVRIENNFTL